MSTDNYVRVDECIPPVDLSHQQQEIDLEEQSQLAIEEYDRLHPDSLDPVPVMTKADQDIYDSLHQVLKNAGSEFLKHPNNNKYYERSVRLLSANQKNSWRQVTHLTMFENNCLNSNKIGKVLIFEAIAYMVKAGPMVHIIQAPGTLFHKCKLSLQPLRYDIVLNLTLTKPNLTWWPDWLLDCLGWNRV